MEKSDPKVSVIIPTYNRAHLLLPRAVKSVLNQTFTDFELIIVDDASTDNTKEVVESFNDSQIRYMRHEQNKGGGAARNTGIEKARGEFIAFLDSDDEWMKEKLERQIAAFSQANPRIGFIFCGMKTNTILNSSSYVSITSPTVYGDISTDVLTGILGCHLSGLMVRRSTIVAIGGFDPILASSQDWDLMIRLSQISLVSSVPDILAVYHKHESHSITRNLEALIAGRERILNKHWNLIQHNNRSLSFQYRDIARFCLLAGYHGKALRYLIKTVKVSRFRNNLSLLPWFVFLGLGPTVSRIILNLRRHLRSILMTCKSRGV